MWNIVVRDFTGNYYRETSDSLPDQTDLDYWEDYHKIWKGVVLEKAVVVNVFKTEDV